MDDKKKRNQMMNFIFNALENGWEVKKRDGCTYVFRKRHNGDKKGFLHKQYLEKFICSNLEKGFSIRESDDDFLNHEDEEDEEETPFQPLTTLQKEEEDDKEFQDEDQDKENPEANS